MKTVVLLCIRGYQRFVSGEKGIVRFFVLPSTVCRFTPSCSQYTYDAVSTYGILKGLWMGAKRILRCGPWSLGGLDPLIKKSS